MLNQAHHLLQAEEAFTFATQSYRGTAKRDKLKYCNVDWNIAEQRSMLKALKPRIRLTRHC